MKRKAPGSKKQNGRRSNKSTEQAEQRQAVQLVSGAAAEGAISALLDRMERQPENFIWFESDFKLS